MTMRSADAASGALRSSAAGERCAAGTGTRAFAVDAACDGGTAAARGGRSTGASAPGTNFRRAAAAHAAHEGPSREGIEALLLESLELARAELELLRDARERQSLRLPRPRELFANPGVFGRRASHTPRAAAPDTHA